MVGFVFALPIFPGSRPPSIVGADELNFCVRDGNRWTLIAINTNSVWVAFNHLLYQKPNGFGCQLIVAYAEPVVNNYFADRSKQFSIGFVVHLQGLEPGTH